MKVHIIEDDADTLASLRLALSNSHTVESSASLAQARQSLIPLTGTDIIILDLNLGDGNGLTLCRELRRHGEDVPIIMLTAEMEKESIAQCLDSGADDYLVKPFDLRELQARIRALLRRSTTGEAILSHLDLRLDPSCRLVSRHGKQVSLTRKQFDILEFLLRRKGTVVTRRQLLDHLWDESSETLESTVDVHIKLLRDRIDRPYARPIISTVSGVGYTIKDNQALQ